MGKITLAINATNITTLLSTISKQSIPIYNVRSTDQGIIFTTYNKYYPKLVELCSKMCYTISVVKANPIRRIKHTLVSRIGVVIGLVAALVGYIITSQYTFYINVFGLNYTPKQDILSCLDSYGVSVGKINHFDNDKLEEYIISNVDSVSLVSVNKVGNTININIREKLPDVVDNKAALIAPQNMLITSINVVKGTTKYKVGDIVHKGDILVYPYYINNDGQQLPCEAVATIVGDTWFSASIEFVEDTTEYVRTGHKVSSMEYYLGSARIYSKRVVNNYTSYEVEGYSYNISSILPISVKGSIIYETTPVELHRSIDEYRDGLIAQSYTRALELVPEGYSIIDRSDSETKVGNKYIISVYLRSIVEVNNVN